VLENVTTWFRLQVEDHSKRISECYQEVCSAQIDSRLKGQQATRAAENYTWNTRLVKSQAEIMGKIYEECLEHIKQARVFLLFSFFKE